MDWADPTKSLDFRPNGKAAAMASTVAEQRFLFADDAPGGAEVSTSRTPVRVFQDLLFDEGIWAVREAVRFDHIEELQHHLEANLPQNSEATRHRYAQSILKWFFPTGTPDSLARQVWTAYGDESLVQEILRLLYLQAEPLLGECVVEALYPIAVGSLVPHSYLHQLGAHQTARGGQGPAAQPHRRVSPRQGGHRQGHRDSGQRGVQDRLGSRSSREDELARQLVEKAYDEPLFQYQEFNKDFQDADARKVLHGLFRPINSRSSTDNGAGQLRRRLGPDRQEQSHRFRPPAGRRTGMDPRSDAFAAGRGPLRSGQRAVPPSPRADRTYGDVACGIRRAGRRSAPGGHQSEPFRRLHLGHRQTAHRQQADRPPAASSRMVWQAGKGIAWRPPGDFDRDFLEHRAALGQSPRPRPENLEQSLRRTRTQRRTRVGFGCVTAAVAHGPAQRRAAAAIARW